MPLDTISVIRKYFDCLALISQGPIKLIEPDSKLNTVEIRQLQSSGLIYIGAASIAGSLHDVSITPEGAVKLVEWGEIIESASLKRKWMSSANRLMWAVVSLGFAVAAGVIIKILEYGQ